MPQLVGVPCFFCGQRIESEWEGRFCPFCGFPSHNGCREARLREAYVGSCPDCGVPKETVRVIEQDREEGAVRQEEKVRRGQGLKQVAAGGIVALFGVGCLLGHLLGQPGPFNLLKAAVLSITAGIAFAVDGFRRAAESGGRPRGVAPGRGGVAPGRFAAQVAPPGSEGGSVLAPPRTPATQQAIRPERPSGPGPGPGRDPSPQT